MFADFPVSALTFEHSVQQDSGRSHLPLLRASRLSWGSQSSREASPRNWQKPDVMPARA